MVKVRIAAFAATSDEIPGRRFQLTEEDIRSMAERTRPDDPLYYNHDQRDLIASRVLVSELRRTDSGSLGLWVEREIDDEVLSSHETVGGYSITFAKEAIGLDPDSEKPQLQLVIDSEQFDDEQFVGVVADLQRDFNVSAGWALQYSTEPPALVMVALGTQWLLSIPPEVIKAVLVRVLADRLLRTRSRQASHFDFRLAPDEITLTMDTDDAELLGLAVTGLADIARSGESGAYVFDESTKRVRRIRD